MSGYNRRVAKNYLATGISVIAGCAVGAALSFSSAVRSNPAPVNDPAAKIAWDLYSLRLVLHRPGEFYEYAPSVIADGNVEHIWSCQNAEAGVIRDHIFYTKRVKGAVVENRSVLEGGPAGTWDSFHTCDPSVLKTRVVYDGVKYDYIMFYLGNDVNASRHNQIGAAFAKSIGGPWKKYLAPIVTSDDPHAWGVGQPSAINLDSHGRILLFYTQGDHLGTRAYRREFHLDDTAHPLIGDAVLVTTDGLTGTDGVADWLNNFDVAYDPSSDRFFAVREQHPKPTTHPRYIGASLQIASIDAASIWKGGGKWRVEGAITPDLTGFPRNHNGGIKRTAIGTLPNPHQISVVFSRSCADTGEFTCKTPEWSYNLWEITGAL